ncbi:MAG: type II toxin-antitoxin system VapC family toxin [Chloroflexi bacterium]|nr:MAG: type II toxin-antitoxin system VapC family toxin [Chloroflexota bacterium]
MAEARLPGSPSSFGTGWPPGTPLRHDDTRSRRALPPDRGRSIWRPDPTNPPRRVPNDSGDDYLVALALENDADLLVTRDRHFDGLSFDGIRIEFPGGFLARLMS